MGAQDPGPVISLAGFLAVVSAKTAKAKDLLQPIKSKEVDGRPIVFIAVGGWSGR